MAALRYRFQTLHFDQPNGSELDIHVRTLLDGQQYADPDNTAFDLGISSAQWPLFGTVWPSSLVLAKLMATADIKALRILELGCGIGLASLVLNHRDANIVASDQHPSVNEFLQFNVHLNGDAPIAFRHADWNNPAPLGQFDLIIGSDLLYEAQHVQLLADTIVCNAAPKASLILVDPGRGHLNRLTKQLSERRFDCSKRLVHSDDALGGTVSGHILTAQLRS